MDDPVFSLPIHRLLGKAALLFVASKVNPPNIKACVDGLVIVIWYTTCISRPTKFQFLKCLSVIILVDISLRTTRGDTFHILGGLYCGQREYKMPQH